MCTYADIVSSTEISYNNLSIKKNDFEAFGNMLEYNATFFSLFRPLCLVVIVIKNLSKMVSHFNS